jgi:hypothetical protein
MAAGFGGLAALGEAFHAPAENVRFAENARKLAGQMATLSKLMDTTDFSVAPMAYFNVYAAAALTISKLVEQGSQEAAMSAVLTELQKIAEQIEELRKTMIARFDDLDFNMRYYFDRTNIDLSNIKSSTARIEQQIALVITKIDQLNVEMITGFRFMMLDDLVDWQTKCLTPVTSQVALRQRKLDVPICRNKFAEYALMEWSHAIGRETINGGVADLASLTDEQQNAIQQYVTDITGSSLFQNNNHPLNWILGTTNFLRLFQVNPNYKKLAVDSGFNGRSDLSLEALIARGDQIEQGLETLILEKSGDNYKLKTGVFEKIVDDYSKNATRALVLGRAKASQYNNNGPSREQQI